ncbi:MAG: phage tail protein [Sediminibacterium sp.]
MLPISVEDFKSTINKRGGIARANRFAVYMHIPIVSISLSNIITNLIKGDSFTSGMVNSPKDISILCETTGIPGIDLGTVETGYGIKRRKMPNQFDQQDVTFTFTLTNDYFSRNFLNTWMNAVVNRLDGTVNYKKDYMNDIVIQQLDTNNFPVAGVKLYNAYPVSVQEITLSNNNDNSITTVSATFTYDYAIQTDTLATALDAGAVMVGSLGFKIGF